MLRSRSMLRQAPAGASITTSTYEATARREGRQIDKSYYVSPFPTRRFGQAASARFAASAVSTWAYYPCVGKKCEG
eukprot:27702-Chlamydomonas_euryale.AAC.2